MENKKYQQFDLYTDYLIHQLREFRDDQKCYNKFDVKTVNNLMYIAYVYYLTNNNQAVHTINNRLFSLKIEAWIDGPVIPHLFQRFKKHNPVEIKIKKKFKIPESAKRVLDFVVFNFGLFDNYQLENLVHDQPWRSARKYLRPLDISHNNISDYDIYNHYG